jgi:lycopene beta-cyclase
MDDVLIIGAGPAGVALGAALADAGLRVGGLAPQAAQTRWPNTYGIWRDEIDELGLAHLLSPRFANVVVYAGGARHDLGREYGLFDNTRLQSHLLDRCDRGGMVWRQGSAARIDHTAAAATVTTTTGAQMSARVVVDASGHKAALVQRPPPGRGGAAGRLRRGRPFLRAAGGDRPTGAHGLPHRPSPPG